MSLQAAIKKLKKAIETLKVIDNDFAEHWEGEPADCAIDHIEAMINDLERAIEELEDEDE